MRRRWSWRRWSGRGRPPKPRFLSGPPFSVVFLPSESIPPGYVGEVIYITPDEIEALKLVYYEGMSQEEAAEKMGVSRGTLWRLLSSGRAKLIRALVELKPLVISD